MQNVVQPLVERTGPPVEVNEKFSSVTIVIGLSSTDIREFPEILSFIKHIATNEQGYLFRHIGPTI